jgi:mitogen-activated protein kinase kinase
MLLKHPWLKPLSKPATITEDDEDEDAVEGAAEDIAATPIGTGIKDEEREGIPILEPDGRPTPTGENSYDTEVAQWVQNAIQRKKARKMGTAVKPALHAAPLDSVSPGVDRG